MDTPDLLPRPAMRRLLQASDPVAEGGQDPSLSFSAQVMRGTGRLAAFFSRMAWHATTDLARTGFGRIVSHVAVLGVTVGALALGAGAAAAPEVAPNVSLRASATAENPVADFPLFAGGGLVLYQQRSDVIRQADPYTVIPNRPRRGVIEYTVQPGDVLFTIASRFNVSPESILWNNQDALNNDPHKILPGTVLVIPPVSGIIHTIKDGDTLESVAAEYKVTVEAITIDGVQWNNLLEGRLPPAGSTLIVPGGQREFKGWEPPRVTRATSSGPSAPALGACADVSGGGLAGSGSFIWPVNNHWVGGYNYSLWHRGLDLAGRRGDPVYAADSGFVVYAGWSPVGYGNLIVIEHANGWQTWYGHLNQIFVTCGQDVWQGSTIGAVGSTGNSTGPHLHFETRYQGELPNPFSVLPPP